jgi:hypothetical protein
MASAPQNQLPLFYNGLEPLSSQVHAKYRARMTNTAPFLVGAHAIPVTIDEFSTLQRFMPIVFTSGDDSIPIALMGLNEGVNVFVDDNGKLTENNLYVPAYVRRYPYMLARLRPDAEEMSLCFDPTSDRIGEFEDGEALFVDGEPTETTKGILAFNESFEQAGARTAAFMKELNSYDLLMDGEMSIQPEGAAQPFVYRGFRMIDEKKLTDIRGDQLRRMNQSGMLPLIYAHLFSLSLMREIFGRQVEQGKLPQPEPQLSM